MAKAKKEAKSGNLYDRIFKENAEYLFIPLIQRELQFKIKEFEAIPDRFTRTLERETDFLYRVLTESEECLILHLEFQTKDDPEMLFRMEEYHALIHRKYKLPVKHIVVYLGAKEVKMRSKLEEKEIFSGFEIISLHQLDTSTLLSSQVPEVILLALLSNYEKERTEVVLRYLLKALKQASNTPDRLEKYLQQLIILSRLRNLEEKTIKAIEDMVIEYDVEQDYLYKMGIEKGAAREQERMKQEMLLLEEAKSILEEERQQAEREKAIAEQERAVAEKEKERIAVEKAIAEQERERIAKEKAIAEQEKERIAVEKAIAEQERERIAVEKAIAEQERERTAVEKAIAEQEKERIAEEKAIAEQEKERINEEKVIAEQKKEIAEQEKEQIKQKQIATIQSLIRLNLLSEEQIAEIVQEPLSYIQAIKAAMQKDK
ncbi:MAG: hypothetical protein AAF849_05950 [Bacteroidota bacterium]